MNRIPRQHDPTKIYYFAYGANLSSQTLVKRSVINQINQSDVIIPCRAKDPSIAFAFCHRSGYATLILNKKDSSPLEQAWVDLQCDDNVVGDQQQQLYHRPVHGVLYQLTPDQLQTIQRYEVGYKLALIEVIPYNSNNDTITNTTDNNDITYHAVTFVSSPALLLRHPVPPTERYRSLILQGAQEHQLHEEYIMWLSSIPTITSPSNIAMRPEYSNTLFEALCRVVFVTVSTVSCGYFILHSYLIASLSS